MRGVIKIKLKEMLYEGVDRINLIQDRNQLWALVNRVINFRVP
jgi:hypothetical protein